MRILLAIILLISVACQKSGEGDGSSNTPNGSAGNTNPNQGKGCVSSKVLAIFGNEMIASVNGVNTDQILLWDFKNTEIKTKINSGKSFFKFSEDHRYYLRKFSEYRYELVGNAENTGYSEPLYFAGNAELLKFNNDSSLLYGVLNFNRTRNKNYFVVFDIDKKEVFFNTTMSHIKIAQVDDMMATVITGQNTLNKMVRINLIDKTETEHLLSMGHMDEISYSKDVVLGKIRSSFYAHSKTDGTLLYYNRNRFIYDIDYENNLALSMKRNGRIHLFNMLTGEEVKELNLSDEIIASSCKIIKNSHHLICQSRFDANKVIYWDADTSTHFDKCI